MEYLLIFLLIVNCIVGIKMVFLGAKYNAQFSIKERKCKTWNIQDYMNWIYNGTEKYPAKEFLLFLQSLPLHMVQLTLTEKEIDDIITRMSNEGFDGEINIYFNRSQIQ